MRCDLFSVDAGVVAPTWSQTEVVGGIIPTPLPFRSLTHDMNHMWNIVHIHNPCAEDMSALNNTSSHAVHPTGIVIWTLFPLFPGQRD